MYEYIVGKISYSNHSYLILENNFIGYKIFANHIDQYDKKTFHRFYLYVKINQNTKGNQSYEYYGFKNIFEKYFFELLLEINGIGPKTAMTILKNDISLLKNLIIENDIKTLENMIGFNQKLAFLVTNQLGYKLRSINSSKKNNDECIDNSENNSTPKQNCILDVLNALKSMGYKKTDIDYAIIKVQDKINNYDDSNIKVDINDLISDAIKIILNKNENSTN